MSDQPLHSGPRDHIPNPGTLLEESGPEGLKARLAGLSRDALEEVVRAHPPHHTPPMAMETMTDDQLIGYIVDGAKRGKEPRGG